MSATILSNISSFEYEPDITTDNSRDGITTYQFSVVGLFEALNANFLLGQELVAAPDQPRGRFKIVRRNMSHIAGNTVDGLYRLQVSAEGGEKDGSLFILETSYQYHKEVVSGIQTFSPTGSSFLQVPFQYVLEFLSPSVTLTTNSNLDDVEEVQGRAIAIALSLNVEIIRDKPPNTEGKTVEGPSIDLNNVYIVGSSVENAGGLFRVRASATRGSTELIL